MPNPPADMPSGLTIFAIGFCVMGTFLLLLWAVNYLKGWRPSHMSSTGADLPPREVVADRLPATATNGGQGIAKPGNAVNAELPGNALPEEAREIVRFQAKVEAVIAIVESGKVGQTEAIELVFNCKRSGRPDSPYGKARAAVHAQMGPAPVEYISDLRARVDREVAEEARR